MKIFSKLNSYIDRWLSKSGKPLLATHDGLSFLTDDMSFIRHINKGKSEPYTGDLDLVKKYLQEYPERNRTYVDVGGHIGTTIIPYSRLFSSVYGYEPNKKSFSFLKYNIEINKITNAVVNNTAVLNRKFTGTIKQHNKNNSGCYYFEEDKLGEIEAITLDSQNLKDVDFLKVDTEGSELLVLQGAGEILKQDKPLVLIEINGMSEQNFGIKSKDVYDYLQKFGYTVYGKCVNNIYFYVPDEID